MSDVTIEHGLLLAKLIRATRNLQICEERLVELQDQYDEVHAEVMQIQTSCPELNEEKPNEVAR